MSNELQGLRLFHPTKKEAAKIKKRNLQLVESMFNQRVIKANERKLLTILIGIGQIDAINQDFDGVVNQIEVFPINISYSHNRLL